MEAKLILHPLPSKLQFTTAKSSHRSNRSPPANATPLRKLSILRATPSSESNTGGSGGVEGKEGGGGGGGDTSNAATTERRASPTTLNIRYRSRRKARQDLQKQQQGLKKSPTPAKKWEEMTLTEKASELYVGEKGLLFWLNKFAYASIFVVIGGWILFRFVGPSIGLYQLDAPPLSPTAIFKDG